MGATLAPFPPPASATATHGATIGVLDYDFGNYEILPTSSPSCTRKPCSDSDEKADGGASWPSRHLMSKTSRRRIRRVNSTPWPIRRTQPRSTGCPCAGEIQDNDGPTNDGVVARTKPPELIDAIKTAGGPHITRTRSTEPTTPTAASPAATSGSRSLSNRSRTALCRPRQRLMPPPPQP